MAFLLSASKHLCNYGSEAYAEHFSETILNLEVVQEEMLFKRYFVSRALAAPSVDWNHLCNFGRVHHQEQFCEIILNLDQWIRCR